MIELDSDNFRRGHDAFLRHMQQKGDGVPFTGFGHRFFVTDETAYKEETLAKARKLLEPGSWPEWSKTPGKIVERLKQACDITVSGNLFEHKYGNENGSYSALYRVDEPDVPEFEAHCVELSRVANSPDEINGPAVDSFAEFLRDKRLGCKWEFVAYILFVLRPERFFPIRSTHFDKVLEFYGLSDKIAGRVEWSRYRLLLDVADAVRERLRIYGSATAIQVQSYMWVINYLLPLDEEELVEQVVDFEEELRRRQEREKERQRIGVLGERYVYESEKQRLTKAGRPDLADRVTLVSAIDENTGYDVSSFETNGDELHIEVKSTTRSKQNDDCFWLSQNEVRVGTDDPRWTVYRVWDVDTGPTHANLGNIAKQEPDGWTREPSTWVIRRNEGV
ncbi:MAG: DUF3883 domain-containing protein [Pirellulales bacterium]